MTFEQLMSDTRATAKERRDCALLLAMIRIKVIFKFLKSENAL